jgi:hypothetical protein
LGIVFDDGNDFGGWCGWLGIVWLQYVVSHVYVLPGLCERSGRRATTRVPTPRQHHPRPYR